MNNKIKIFLIAFFLICHTVFASVEFDGVDDYVEVPHNSSLDGFTSMSIAAWVYPTTSGFGTLVSKYTEQGYIFYVGTATVKARLFLDASTPSNVDSNSFLTQNAWNHIVVSWNGSNASFYLNGIADGSPSITSPGISDTGTLRIGINWFGFEAFTGLIDDVRIYNRALTSQEIANLYGSRSKYSSITSGLVGYWPMDDYPDGTTLTTEQKQKDRSGNGNDGTPTNSPIQRATTVLSYQ